MEPFEKEQILYNEIHSIIESVLRENNITYFQVFGVLDAVKDDYMQEFKEQSLLDELNEEDEDFE